MNLKCLSLSVYIVLETTEAVTWSCCFIKIHCSQENISSGVSFKKKIFFLNWLGEEKRKALAQVFSREFWEIYWNTNFENTCRRLLWWQSSMADFLIVKLMPLCFKLILLIILKFAYHSETHEILFWLCELLISGPYSS